MAKQKVFYQDLNRISFQEAWDYQGKIQKSMIQHKLSKRGLSGNALLAYKQNHHLLFCQHNPVYTLGKSGTPDNLLLDDDEMKKAGVEYFKINRGGDITFHGPGQITGYPIFDLDEFFTDVHRYVRTLEEIVIRTIAHYNIEGKRLEGYTGVWINEPHHIRPYRKICAFGVHLSRWVTMHGFALNVNTDLSYFENIIPCGIEDKDKSVTSIQKELGQKVDINEVKMILKTNFASLFDYEYVDNRHAEVT